ncbi:MAG: hypothetical protein LBG96_10185 [Tannerella sp.]|nr:hypothetical protein [Tannerella sp.]
MATGRYSGKNEELIGQDMDFGVYKYTIRQVVEPWVISIGPDLASLITNEETISGLSVWSFDNMLHIHSDINTTAYIYNMRGVMYKCINVTEGSIKFRTPILFANRKAA